LGFEAVVALLFVQKAEAINPVTNTTFKNSVFFMLSALTPFAKLGLFFNN
jgi:hypothetical protein